MPSGSTSFDVVVRSADDGAEHRAFVRLPYRLYESDRQWSPPLRLEERQRWSPKRNASLRTRRVRRFVALRDGRVAGRIAAIEDPAFTDRWERGTGWFGFFESVNDVDVAAALLSAAEGALLDWGLSRILGPINLTTHDETGILVDGYDEPASVMTPYNPLYYARLFEACGYSGVREYHAFRAKLDGDLRPALARVVRAHAEAANGELRIRPLNLRRWDDEVRTVFELYNAAFQDVWGFVRISWDEFRERTQRFRPFVIPDLVPIAELAGEPVGFALTLPDVNIALARARGRLLPLGWLHLLRATRHIRSARFILLGVRPERTGRGIGALLALHVREAARRLGIDPLELSLVQTANDRVRQIIDAFACPATKTYRLYQKPLAGAAVDVTEMAAV